MEPAASYTKKGIHTKQLKVLKIYLITNFKHELKNFGFPLNIFGIEIGGSWRNDNKKM